jgi:hypothetical protein
MGRIADLYKIQSNLAVRREPLISRPPNRNVIFQIPVFRNTWTPYVVVRPGSCVRRQGYTWVCIQSAHYAPSPYAAFEEKRFRHEAWVASEYLAYSALIISPNGTYVYDERVTWRHYPGAIGFLPYGTYVSAADFHNPKEGYIKILHPPVVDPYTGVPFDLQEGWVWWSSLSIDLPTHYSYAPKMADSALPKDSPSVENELTPIS